MKTGIGTPQELIEPTRMLLEAELDLCGSDKERLTVLEKILAEAAETERLADRFAKMGQGHQSTALMAKAGRLRIEISLERAKAGKDLPQKGAARSGPDAKIKNGNQQTTTLPATIQAYESVRLFAQVSGVLKKQTVDIGDRVKRGQMLAVLEAVGMEGQVKHDHAALDQARARVDLANVNVAIAEADLETVKLAVKQAEGIVKSAAASARFRASQLKRMNDLLAQKSIDEKIVDEAKERHEAAVETEQSAKAAVGTAKAQIVAGMAKIQQARANVNITKAGVAVAQANLEKSQAQLSLATIDAPFDGVITQRGYFPGDFIRSADRTNNDAPLLIVERMDVMRVSVAIPDRDVSFVNVGDAAEIEIDALPGKKFQAKVSRIAVALDPKTRSMSVEIDLPNPTGAIYPGMTARATIAFAKRKE